MALLFLFSHDLFSQKHDYNWMFRTRWSDTTILLSFKDYPQIEEINLEMEIQTTNATMSDFDGKYLFNTNGCFIAGPNFEVMENGDELNPGERRKSLCNRDRGYSAGHQSAMTLPFPGNENLYYLFHHSYFLDPGPPLNIDDDALRYSLIDMSANNGLGAVIEKNEILIGDTTTYVGHLTAVKHANNRDWWLFIPLQVDQKYARFLIDSSGIHPAQYQQIGDSISIAGEGGGGGLFLPDGSKYVRWDPRNGIFIFDFDRETGLLSNYEWVDTRVDSVLSGGLAISSNSRFLYTTTFVNLFQYDLEAEDILASEVLIDTYDGFQDPFSCNFWQAQLAPDCKIYIASTASCNRLGVIHSPNKKGKACDFRQHDFLIGGSSASLLHFPNYRLGTAPVCDSSLVVKVIKVFSSLTDMEIFPNPATDRIYVRTEGFDGSTSLLRILDMHGREMERRFLESDELELDVSSLGSGFYLFEIRDELGNRRIKKVFVH